ncbi:hypothetical protein [Spirochaeta africana]|uniref:Peptidase C-terminal archaeal/bacterial domain-containing protein n=1 Tax=Spirochaeta africana (strain ATCC 700263 / DSM 8902 / Z-7692) TaxID=889378 RepID=H9UGV9_SPIAZ|nr:hypothetical protein [Spirochaeta africana]AFG36752.1 hypothetical protein Spiaf_0652 [Spirochaeta africana DSM 8902]
MNRTLTMLLIALAGSSLSIYAQVPEPHEAARTYRLEAGFNPDPLTMEYTAGGSIASQVPGLGDFGYITELPLLILEYHSDGMFPLHIYLHGDEQSSIIMYDPAGRWYASGPLYGQNPGILLDEPLSGEYLLWFGSYRRAADLAVTLFISEFRTPRYE